MKIYQINVVCGSGSTGRIVVDLAQIIEFQGDKCRIAYGRGIAPDDVDSYRIGGNCSVYWHALLTRLTGRHGLYSRVATKRLINDIREYNPDIIHLHNLHGYYLNYEILFRYLRESGKPVVWTMHDCWAFTGHCAHYESVDCEKWQSGCDESCINLLSYPISRTAKNVKGNFERKKREFSQVDNLTIVTPSLWLAEQVKNSFLKGKMVTTIPNGIDLCRFSPKKSDIKKQMGIEKKHLVLGVASVWTEKKGLNDFFELSQILDDTYAVCLVGLSRKQIAELPKRVIGIAKTSSIEELSRFYSSADVFVNLTYEDTFPTTNIEALACGTPVITYRTGGSPEIIETSCGGVVEKGDFAAIKYLIENMCERNNMVNSCVKRASEFNKNESYRQYLSLYREVL